MTRSVCSQRRLGRRRRSANASWGTSIRTPQNVARASSAHLPALVPSPADFESSHWSSGLSARGPSTEELVHCRPAITRDFDRPRARRMRARGHSRPLPRSASVQSFAFAFVEFQTRPTNLPIFRRQCATTSSIISCRLDQSPKHSSLFLLSLWDKLLPSLPCVRDWHRERLPCARVGSTAHRRRSDAALTKHKRDRASRPQRSGVGSNARTLEAIC